MLLQKLQENEWDETVFFTENSFMHKFYLSHLPEPSSGGLASDTHLVRPPVKTVHFQEQDNSNNDLWDTLPKHLWTIWDRDPHKQSSVVVELCVENLRKSAENSGLEFHIVTQDNIKEYLSQETQQKIEYATSHATLDVTKQLLSDLWRLAFLKEHGGIYADITTFTLE